MTSRREVHRALCATSLALLFSPRTFAADASVTTATFDQALKATLAQEPLIESAAAERERQVWEAAYYSARPLVGRPSPSETPISERAKQLIVGFEVIDSAHYVETPIWPGRESGVTIGIGYDVGYARPEWIRQDWPTLGEAQIGLLSKFCGVTGMAAKAHLTQLQSIRIPWDQADGCSGLISSDRSIGGQSGIDEEKEQDDKKAPTI
ncbi:hypothetical protein B0G69_7536 [Paraburkholderia sp. RAU2J]|uniref:hypothetical protein n=1 Tax=Paraburkholderia sp. RAU2J TaxID=1938810 RepID=UPI000F159EED|nr:hypothetical protein [Paraburkholderia sp. RAU2J]RKT14288.1 hypothetical protein B0G69_7536 [Paraburkholderia sp. RAU2J]